MPRPLNLIVALPAEARPLRRHFGLRRQQPAGDPPLYDNGRMRLLICGCGARAAARGVQRLAAGGQGDALWLNMGIAGHPEHPRGLPFIAGEIHDAAGSRHWHTALPADPPCPAEPLFTLSGATRDYPHPGLCDMEGAAFYGAALAHAPPAMIHCLKVVSDNPRQPVTELNGKRVSALVGAHIEVLERLIAAMERAP